MVGEARLLPRPVSRKGGSISKLTVVDGQARAGNLLLERNASKVINYLVKGIKLRKTYSGLPGPLMPHCVSFSARAFNDSEMVNRKLSAPQRR